MHLGAERFRRIALGVTLAVVATVGGIIAASWPHAVHELMREKSPLGTLSVALLVASAGVAGWIGLRHHRGFWVLSVALVVLAIDERVMGHERLKRALLEHLYGWDRRAMGVVGDLPLVVMAVAGTVALLLLRRHFPRLARALLLGAVATGAVALGLDVATERPGVQALEEVLEVTAETLFLLSLLAVMAARPGTASPRVDAG